MSTKVDFQATSIFSDVIETLQPEKARRFDESARDGQALVQFRFGARIASVLVAENWIEVAAYEHGQLTDRFLPEHIAQYDRVMRCSNMQEAVDFVKIVAQG